MENLFSYATLQSESVQLSTFGRKLEGYADCLVGYKLSFIKIEDETVVASSGMAEHPIITFTNNSGDTIHGIVVDKKRKIYFIDNVKFHFGKVEGLGTFIEVEAIDNKEEFTIEELKRQCDKYFEFF